MRNMESCTGSFCNWKERRPVALELKRIYNAETAELAVKRLEEFAQSPWGKTLTSHLSPLTSHLSPLTSHLSPLTSHLSPLTSHLSPLTLRHPVQPPHHGMIGPSYDIPDTVRFSAGTRKLGHIGRIESIIDRDLFSPSDRARTDDQRCSFPVFEMR
jgi:hypothetical protein